MRLLRKDIKRDVLSDNPMERDEPLWVRRELTYRKGDYASVERAVPAIIELREDRAMTLMCVHGLLCRFLYDSHADAISDPPAGD